MYLPYTNTQRGLLTSTILHRKIYLPAQFDTDRPTYQHNLTQKDLLTRWSWHKHISLTALDTKKISLPADFDTKRSTYQQTLTQKNLLISRLWHRKIYLQSLKRPDWALIASAETTASTKIMSTVHCSDHSSDDSSNSPKLRSLFFYIWQSILKHLLLWDNTPTPPTPRNASVSLSERSRMKTPSIRHQLRHKHVTQACPGTSCHTGTQPFPPLRPPTLPHS